MRVECRTWTDMGENDDGADVECTYVKCSLCGHQTTSYGTSDGSLKRCLLLMRKECPRGENNFYVKPSPPKRSGGFGISN